MTKIFYKYALYLVLFLSFTSCSKVYHLSDVSNAQYRINQESFLPNDPDIDSIIAPYKEQLEDEMNLVINELDIDLEKSKPESTLSNWMTDIVHEYTVEHTDLPVVATIQNYGGIRINGIGKGHLMVRKIYELMPFDNEIVLVEMNGDYVLQLFNKIAKSKGWPVSSGVKLIINNGEIESLLMNGEEIDPERTYYVGMSDYVASGGDGIEFLPSLPHIKLGVKVRDAIIHQIKVHQKLGQVESSQLDQRIIIK